MYSVWVYYNLDKYEWGTLDEPMRKLAAIYKGKNTGGGTGFDLRDQSFDFDSRNNAEAFEKAIRDKYDVKVNIFE